MSQGKGEKFIKKIATITTPENTLAIEAKRSLNPGATEFVSSRSESEASSIGDEEEIRHLESEETSAIQKTKSGLTSATARHQMEQYPQEDTVEQRRFHSYQNYGWESPQGVLPPPVSGQGAGAYTTVPGMMPPHQQYSNNSHQYGPSHYPVYHVYSTHHPDAIDRAGSPPPPAMYAPAGSSPPLAPGFISVSLQNQHSGHLRGASPPLPGGSPTAPRGMHPAAGAPPMPVHHHHAISMGSSPPNNGFAHEGGHYHVYAAPHHAYPGLTHHGNQEFPPQHHLSANTHYNHGQQHHNNGMMAELQPRLSSMSLDGSSPPEGSSPTGRNSTRASARIARSHRAGGAYNPSDFEFKISPVSSGESNADATTDAAATPPAEIKTTVMVKNIPNKYSQGIMLSLLEEAGLNGSFDFFYLPIDFRTHSNLGYAFLNFLTHRDAVAAYSHFHQRRWDEFNSKKVCEVTYARVQGRDNLVHHFKNAKFPSTDAEYCPLVYQCGNQIGGDGDEVRAHMPLPIHDYLATLEDETPVAEINGEENKVEGQEQE